jgi:hypothetical protein
MLSPRIRRLKLDYDTLMTLGLRKSPLADLLTNIASMFVDVLPASCEQYIVSEGRSHSMPRTARSHHLLGT